MSSSIMLGLPSLHHPKSRPPFRSCDPFRLNTLKSSYFLKVAGLSEKLSQLLESSLILFGKPVLLGAVNIDDRDNLIKISLGSAEDVHLCLEKKRSKIDNVPFHP